MEYVGLLFYCLQQLGVSLGVGAATVEMVYKATFGSRDTLTHAEQKLYGTATGVMRGGLFLVLISGLAITTAHLAVGEYDILLSPVFLAKWLFLGLIITAEALGGFALLSRIFAAVTGATWYSFFLIHTLGFTFSWDVIAEIYAVFLALFILAFYILVQKTNRARIERATQSLPVPTPDSAPKLHVVPLKSPPIVFDLQKKETPASAISVQPPQPIVQTQHQIHHQAHRPQSTVVRPPVQTPSHPKPQQSVPTHTPAHIQPRPNMHIQQPQTRPSFHQPPSSHAVLPKPPVQVVPVVPPKQNVPVATSNPMPPQTQSPLASPIVLPQLP